MRLVVKALFVAALALGTAFLTASPAAALTKQTTIFNLHETSVIAAGDLCADAGPGYRVARASHS